MPTKLRREDDIDNAYNYTPGAEDLKSAESSTDDSYVQAGLDQLDAYRDDPANASRDAVNSRESDTSEASGGWTVNRSEGGEKGASKTEYAVKILKKGGPTGIILSALLGLGGLFSFFGGPGLLIVQIAEVVTDKFNSQVASMDDRRMRILRGKLDAATNGKCSGLVTLRCKYSTFSQRDIDAFKRQGIEVVGDKKSVIGRTKATSLKFTDPVTKEVSTITSKEFDSFRRTNIGFQKALISSYNSKFVSLHDPISLKSLFKSKTSYREPFGDGEKTQEERDKKVLTATREGQPVEKRPRVTVSDTCDATCAAEENKRIDALNDLGNDAERVARDGLKSAQPSGVKTVVSTANSLAVLDDVCMVPRLISAIGTGAKVLRAQQLIRYAMLFLTTASMIKSGDAKPDDVSYFGNTLTKTVQESDGNITKSATDSIGYRYAAFGDKGSTNSSSLYKVGGGVGGDLDGLATKMYGAVGGKGTCDFLANPWTQGAGILISFVPFGGQAIKAGSIAAKAAVKAVVKQLAKGILIGLTLNQIINYLTGIATDMVAGVVVDGTTFGEQSGDAMVTGSAEFHTQTSGMGGNLPLTPDQALAYNSEQERVLAMYDEYDRATLSPLDVTSKATFLGSISYGLLPYLSKMNSISGTISSIASISFSGMKNLTQSSRAHAETADDYRQCEDYQYIEFDVATTPMCNILRGIPAKYLGIEPDKINQTLIASGDIDETSGEPISTKYTDFVAKCLSGEPLQDTDCLLTGPDADTRALFAVHFIDQRVMNISDNGLDTPSPANGPATTSIGGYALPVDQKWFDQHPEWFSKPHHDHPSADIPVPTGTPIYAVTSGRVTAAPNGYGLGVGVTILGDDNIQYDYGHGSDGGKIVKTGDIVKAGQLIMHSASTGDSTGPHLHLGMKRNGVKTCPQTLLTALGKKLATLPSVQSLPTSGCTN